MIIPAEQLPSKSYVAYAYMSNKVFGEPDIPVVVSGHVSVRAAKVGMEKALKTLDGSGVRIGGWSIVSPGDRMYGLVI